MVCCCIWLHKKLHNRIGSPIKCNIQLKFHKRFLLSSCLHIRNWMHTRTQDTAPSCICYTASVSPLPLALSLFLSLWFADFFPFYFIYALSCIYCCSQQFGRWFKRAFAFYKFLYPSPSTSIPRKVYHCMSHAAPNNPNVWQTENNKRNVPTTEISSLHHTIHRSLSVEMITTKKKKKINPTIFIHAPWNTVCGAYCGNQAISHQNHRITLTNHMFAHSFITLSVSHGSKKIESELIHCYNYTQTN